MLSQLLLCLFFTSALTCSLPVSFNWNNVTAVSKTITTLQVVANPILNPAISPVAAHAFANLAALNADYVRYVPWFPYPKVGVAELDPPSRGKTSWDFTNIEPQLRLFMAATYGKGHIVIPNFSTQPTWMYNTANWSYPANPNTVSWDYPRGDATGATTELVAQYYGRLLSWLINGYLIDEYGTKIVNNGPTYNITHWEVYNEPEGCHGLTPASYTAQYDAVVREIRRVADPMRKIKFVGLALSGREMDWIKYFLDPKNHDPDVLPLDFFSFHFYASSASRTDPNSYVSFFSQADRFFVEAKAIAEMRDQMSPHTMIDCDELGIILPNDNDANAPIPPPIYWNAAAGFYAYLYVNMVPMGYNILGESQFAGTPVIPKWGINEAQFPSVSMIDWNTGDGNARYWVLKLLIDNFQPGDQFIETHVPNTPTPYFCGDLHDSIGDVTLKCADPNAVINNIIFAAYGIPTGTCDNLQVNPKCNAKNVTSYVADKCFGQNSCTITSYPTFGDPCPEQVKRMVIKASCTGSKGGFGTPTENPLPVVQGIIDVKTKEKKVLLINKQNSDNCVTLSGFTGRKIYILDEQTKNGPARVGTVSSDMITLAPYAVALIR